MWLTAEIDDLAVPVLGLLAIDSSGSGPLTQILGWAPGANGRVFADRVCGVGCGSVRALGLVAFVAGGQAIRRL
jgi:hypothetical protein